MTGHLKRITNTDPTPFAQGDPGEVWEVQAQAQNSEVYGLRAIVVSYHQRESFGVVMDIEEGRRLPHQFFAVVCGNKLCFIPIKNELEPERQETLYLGPKR